MLVTTTGARTSITYVPDIDVQTATTTMKRKSFAIHVNPQNFKFHFPICGLSQAKVVIIHHIKTNALLLRGDNTCDSSVVCYVCENSASILWLVRAWDGLQTYGDLLLNSSILNWLTLFNLHKLNATVIW